MTTKRMQEMLAQALVLVGKIRQPETELTVVNQLIDLKAIISREPLDLTNPRIRIFQETWRLWERMAKQNPFKEATPTWMYKGSTTELIDKVGELADDAFNLMLKV